MEKIKTINGFLLEKIEENEEIYAECKKLKYSEFLSRIIATKLKKIIDLKDFLDSKIKNLLPNPFDLKDMKEGIGCTIDSILNKEKICIFGDYDVDGSISCALLYKILKEYNIDVSFYIPDRIKEGYGPNVEAVKKIAENNVKLIIFVDCGTLGFEAITEAKKFGINVIVIDHHKSSEILPDCFIINPNRFDEKEIREDLKYLCAGGLCFLFAVGLNIEMQKRGFEKLDLMKFLPLVAIATVCDVVPLVSLNRAFVSTGLKILNNNFNEYWAINGLLEIAEIKVKISIYHFGFVIGPMINAGGRIGQSNLGAKLLSSKERSEIKEIANKLFNLNQERKEIEEKILREIRFNDNFDQNIKDRGFFFEYSENWHEGVIGIISSRIKDFHYRLAIIGSLRDGIIKCSARSIDRIDIGKLILESVELGLLIKGGGHKAAGGFSLYVEKYDKFINFLKEKIKSISDLEFENRKLKYNLVISVDGIEINWLKELQILEPFGIGNSKIIFLIQGAKIIMTKVLKDKHISLLISGKKKSFWTICFNCINREIGKILLSEKILDLVCNIELDFYNNEFRPKIILIDAIKIQQ